MQQPGGSSLGILKYSVGENAIRGFLPAMSSSTGGSPDAGGNAVRRARPVRRPILLGMIALACLVGVVFFPILGFEFVDYDVREQVVDYPYIQGLTAENLKHILTTRHVRSYYPFRTLSYAIDYEIWGLSAGGFKLTNALIHLANVLLVFWLILRLYRRRTAAGGRPMVGWVVLAAVFSAGVFAVHPVVVEPVAWVAGREELLMTLGALGCIHFHLGARRLEEDRSKAGRTLACYAGAAFCCAAACLSNAMAAVIPLLIVAWDVLTLAKPKSKRIFCGTAALWVISMTTIVIKTSGYHPDTTVMAGPFTGQWAMVVLRTYFLNLKTLAWPTHLSLAYLAVMPSSPLEPEVILGGLAVVLTGVVLWKLRGRKLVLFGLLWFCLALGPSSQLIPHHVHRADRFLYLPLAGLVVALAMSLRPLADALMEACVVNARKGFQGKPSFSGDNARQVRISYAGVNKGRAVAGMVAAIAVMILLSLVALSARQVRTWRNSLSVWQQCLRVDGNNPAGHAGLAENLAAVKGFQYAIPHFRAALRLNPNDTTTLNNFALYLAADDNEQLRDYPLAIRLAKRGCELAKEDKSRLRHTLAIAHTNFAVSLAAEGQFGRAIDHCRKAIQADPHYDKPRFNLSLLLARRAEENLRNGHGPQQAPGPQRSRQPGMD